MQFLPRVFKFQIGEFGACHIFESGVKFLFFCGVKLLLFAALSLDASFGRGAGHVTMA